MLHSTSRHVIKCPNHWIDKSKSGVRQISPIKIFVIPSDTTLPVRAGLRFEISIYPNPSTGIFNIDGLEETSTIKIYNAFGQNENCLLNHYKL